MNDDTPDIHTAPVAGPKRQETEARREGNVVKKKRSKAGAKAAAKSAHTAVEARIGYKFADSNLLTTAFTHVSALKPQRKRA